MIKGDVAIDASDDDDEVRTSVSQSHATAMSYTKEFFSGLSIYSPSLTSAGKCWGGGGARNRRSNQHI
jgi:hypothetical protein